MKQLKPSDFAKVHPWSSVFENSENESLACSIMKAKEFKGDEWISIDYQDYLDYRKSLGEKYERGSASQGEFEKVNPYCKSQDTAVLFSKSWKELEYEKS